MMKKIKCVSLFFRLFFQATFICLIAVQLVGWFYAPLDSRFFNVVPLSYQRFILHTFDFNTRVAGFFISSIPLIIKLMVLYYLVKLFRLYEQQEFFSIKNVLYIRNAGYALLTFEIVKPFIDFFLGFILTSGNPPGFRIATVTISDANVGVILTSMLIILSSWIMSEGCKLKEEQQLII